mgnify:CR=1 FL=1
MAVISVPTTGRPRVTSRVRETFRRWPVFQMIVIGIFVIFAAFGEWIAPHDAFETNLRGRLMPPAWLDGGTTSHLFGTDSLGRDIFSRIIVGARASLIVAVVALAAGSVLGGFIGLVSGYYGGRIDAVIMRIADATIAFPLILLALLLTVILGPGILSVVLAASAVLWARFARLIRSEVLSVKQRDYVRLARVAGASNLRIMIVHILIVVVLDAYRGGIRMQCPGLCSFFFFSIVFRGEAWGYNGRDPCRPTDRDPGLEHEEILYRFLTVLRRFAACYADSASD